MLKHDRKVIAIKGSTSIQVLDSDVTVPTVRGYNAGDVIKKGTPLIDIIKKEFTAPKVIIRVVSEDSTRGSTTGTGEYSAGTSVMIQALPFTGYEFSSWGDGNTDNPRTIVALESKTYTAKFSTKPYDVFVRNDGQGTATATPSVAVEGTTIILTASPATGKRFKEWVVVNPQSLVISNNSFTMPNQDVIVRATFEDSPVTTHDITITCGSGGNTTPAGPTVAVAEGSDQTITAVPDYGYRVLEMKIDGIVTAGSSYTFTNVLGDHSFEVSFEEIPPEYTVTTAVYPEAASTAGCTATVNGKTSVTGIAGTAITLVATAASGYSFKQWNDGNTESTRQLTITGNTQYTASFEEGITHKVTSSISGSNGTISPLGEQIVADQGSITFTATPDEGYSINKWYIDGSEVTQTSTSYTFTNVTQDHTISVSFKEAEQAKMINSYVQTTRSAGWVQPTPENINVYKTEEKTAAEIEEIKANGYTFSITYAKSYTVPTLLFPTSLGTPISIKENGVESITDWNVGGTMTYGGVLYNYCCKGSLKSSSSDTAWVIKWQ